jgi:FkbM family methyltransferase
MNPLQRLARAFGKPSPAPAEQVYRCGNVEIVLPPGHKLPEYQRLYPHYDRFLPHLARLLPRGGTIVDVGANVGDTLAAMAAAAPQASYLCVEPDPAFFACLERNIERLRAALPGLAVHARQALVGQQVERASLAGSGGTAHARPDAAGIASVTLDALVAAAGLPPVALLKSDVDGFDFDVLASAERLLAADRPLLFFEAQPLDAAQLAGFERLLGRLPAIGYTRYAVFDNFGQLLGRTGDATLVAQLVRYAWRQGPGVGPRGATRTFYYVDVLAGGERDTATLDAALADY